jgi:hypothetical protein
MSNSTSRPPLELLGEQKGEGQIREDARGDNADDDVLGHRFALQLVRDADVEQAYPEEHEGYSVLRQVLHREHLRSDGAAGVSASA